MKILQAMKNALNLPLILWPSEDGINSGANENQLNELRNGEEYQMTASSVMAVIAALPGLVKLIRELMAAAQDEFGKGTGPDKKAAVMTGVANVIGDETVWAKVQGIFSWTIDCIAAFKPKA